MQAHTTIEGSSLKSNSGDSLLTTISTYLIDHREVELVPEWSLHPYALFALLSLAWESTVSAMERESWPSTQPQNPRLTICPAFNIYWGNGGIELMKVACQYLVKLEADAMRKSPFPTLPAGAT